MEQDLLSPIGFHRKVIPWVMMNASCKDGGDFLSLADRRTEARVYDRH